MKNIFHLLLLPACFVSTSLFATPNKCEVQILDSGKVSLRKQVTLTRGGGAVTIDKVRTLILKFDANESKATYTQLYGTKKEHSRKFTLACQPNLSCRAAREVKAKTHNENFRLKPAAAPQHVDFFDGSLKVIDYTLVQGHHLIRFGDEVGISDPFTGLAIDCSSPPQRVSAQ